MKSEELKSSSKYAWLLVLCLGLMSAGTTGSYSVVAGSFVAPVCQDLGFNYSSFSFYFTATLLGLAIALPFAGKMIPKIVGKPGLTIISLILLAAGALMATYNQLWMFIASGFVIGVCMAFTTGVAMSSVIDQWFREKAGLAIGLAWAVNSIYMLIMSPVITSLTGIIGWRTSYIVLAVVSAILVLPAVIFVIRYQPADKNMLPYGYDPEKDVVDDSGVDVNASRGVPFKAAIKSPAFIACAAFLSLVQISVCMNQLFPTYAVEVGFAPVIGGFMVSAASLCDIFYNPIVGSSCDKFGPVKALLAWIGVSILSFILLIVSTNQGSPTLAIIAAGINDVMYVIAGAGLTVLVMSIFGSRDFSRIFAWICCIGYIAGAFGMPIMTGVYEHTGSFQSVFVFCIILNIAIAILLVLAYKSGKKLPWKNPDAEESAQTA